MDKQEIIAKIDSGEFKSVSELNEALYELHGKGKKVKRAMGNASGSMKADGLEPDRNLTLYLINFDRFLNPSLETDFDE